MNERQMQHYINALFFKKCSLTNNICSSLLIISYSTQVCILKIVQIIFSPYTGCLWEAMNSMGMAQCMRGNNTVMQALHTYLTSLLKHNVIAYGALTGLNVCSTFTAENLQIWCES